MELVKEPNTDNSLAFIEVPTVVQRDKSRVLALK